MPRTVGAAVSTGHESCPLTGPAGFAKSPQTAQSRLRLSHPQTEPACGSAGGGSIPCGLAEEIAVPPISSPHAVFISPEQLDRMRLSCAVESGVNLPVIGRWSSARPRRSPVSTPAFGAFLGFDFHLTSHGRSSSRSTQCRGALLNVALAAPGGVLPGNDRCRVRATADWTIWKRAFFTMSPRNGAGTREAPLERIASWTMILLPNIYIRNSNCSSACSSALE